MTCARVDRWPDSTPGLLHDPYRFISRRCAALGSDLFVTRLLLEKTTCMTGREAAEQFYDTARFTRVGAAPRPVLKTLFGVGGVQGLDGEAHRHRKQLFMSLMDTAQLDELAHRFAESLLGHASKWAVSGPVALYEQMQVVLTDAVCGWAGVALNEETLRVRARQLAAMFDHAGAKGVKHFGARLARRRAESWSIALVRDIRAGRIEPGPDRAAAVIAGHLQLDGRLLDEHTAAVEILNVLRPTVAVSVYITLLVLALHQHGGEDAELRADDAEYALQFVQEVRRYYPFFPFVAARARRRFHWRGHEFPAGRRVLLDLYGTNHDLRAWSEPDRFRPERFAHRQEDAFALVPQGGGDYVANHRCPGEWIVLRLMQVALRFFLAELRYRVPDQDLRLDFRRMPALPRSGLIIDRLQLRA